MIWRGMAREGNDVDAVNQERFQLLHEIDSALNANANANEQGNGDAPAPFSRGPAISLVSVIQCGDVAGCAVASINRLKKA